MDLGIEVRRFLVEGCARVDFFYPYSLQIIVKYKKKRHAGCNPQEAGSDVLPSTHVLVPIQLVEPNCKLVVRVYDFEAQVNESDSKNFMFVSFISFWLLWNSISLFELSICRLQSQIHLLAAGKIRDEAERQTSGEDRKRESQRKILGPSEAHRMESRRSR